MPVVGRLKNGDMLLADEVDERLPAVRSGLIAHYPFDGTLNAVIRPLQGAKVLAWRQSTTYCSMFNYLNSKKAIITEVSDLTTVDVNTAKQYDLILADACVWAVPTAVINKLKEFTDAGVSCIAAGNDTRTNVFVKTYNSTGQATYDILVESDVPYEMSQYTFAGAGNGDLIGGIVELQNGAYPLYRRGDNGLITGYMYDSPSGASLYFDQEGYAYGSPMKECFAAPIQYVLNRSRARINPSNAVILSDRGVWLGEKNENLVRNGAFENGQGVENEFDSYGQYEIVKAPNPLSSISDYVLKQYGGVPGEYEIHVKNGASLSPNTTYRLILWVYHSADFDGSRQTLHAIAYSDSGANVGTGGEGTLIEKWGDWERRYVDITTPSDYNGTFNWYVGYPTNGTKGYRLITGLQIVKPLSAPEYSKDVAGDGFIEIPVGLGTSDFTIAFKVDNVLYGQNRDKTWLGLAQADRAKYINIFHGQGADFYVGDNLVRTSNRLADTNSYSTFDDFYFFIQKTGSTIRIMIYKDGQKWYDQSTSKAEWIFPIDMIRLGRGFGLQSSTSSMGIGRYSNVSIYNRVLSEDEIKKLINPTFQLTPSGKLITSTIVESQILPSDVLYFPLDSRLDDVKGGYKATSSVANLLYTRDGVWVGRNYTNLFTQQSNGKFPIRSGKDLEVITFSPDTVIYRNKFTGETWNYNGQDIAVTAGQTYFVSVEIYVSADFNGNYSFMAAVEHTGEIDFNYDMSRKGVWQKFTHTFTPTSNGNSRFLLYPCPNNNSATQGYVLYRNPQFIASPFERPFINGSIGDGKLEFNLHQSIGLDWSKDWSIVYWKKPIGTHTNNLSGYNIESIGCNSNSVGGGYRWWGKDSGSNTYSVGGTVIQSFSRFSPSDYFGKWEMVSIVKQRNTITWKFWREKDVVTFQQTASISATNHFVTQYGYDFKLGGWDNNNPPNTYYRDLIVAKRALSDAELNTIARTQMRSYVGKLQIQGSLLENQVLR